MKTRSQCQGQTIMLPYGQPVVYVHHRDLYTAYKNDYIQFVLESLFMTDEKKQQRAHASQQPDKDEYILHQYRQDPNATLLLNLPDKKSLLTVIPKNLKKIFHPFFENKQSHVHGRVDAIYQQDDQYTMVILDTRVQNTAETAFHSIKASFYGMYAYKDLPVCRERVLLHNIYHDTMTWIVPTEEHAMIVKDMVYKIRNAKTNASLYWTFQIFPSWLYPNMKHNSEIWEKEKHELAVRTGEITRVWRCTPSVREYAFQSGITTWESPKCTASNLGITPRYLPIIDAILRVNRGIGEPVCIFSEPEQLEELRSDPLLYVDFEWIDSIYLVGVFDGKQYSAYWAASLDNADVYRLLQKVSKCFKNQKIVYWYAEKAKWESQQTKFGLTLIDCEWIDLHNIMRDSVAIRGAFNYKLKEISKALYELGHIPVCIEEHGCQNGRSSIDYAKEYYRTRDPSTQQVLEKYNRFDCEAMYHIVQTIIRTYQS